MYQLMMELQEGSGFQATVVDDEEYPKLLPNWDTLHHPQH